MIRRCVACVASLAMDALIAAWSYRSTRQVPETPQERLARYRREDEKARVRWIDEHRRKDKP